MARSRNIKPGLFKNEDLAECSIWARYLFPGLWCIADREGRLEDRPKRIKGELLAFDNMDVEPLLGELVANGFIARYEVAGQKVIQILTFARHQNPHFREQASELPCMPGWVSPKLSSEKPDAKHTSKEQKAPGMPEAQPISQPPLSPDKPEACPGLSTHESDLERGLSPADSLFSDSLIPDSLSPQPPKGGGARRVRKAEEEPAGFARFWAAWPPSSRKEARGKCAEVWVRNGFETIADTIGAHVAQKRDSTEWTKNGREYVPAPLVYLNQRRWEGAAEAAAPRAQPATAAEAALQAQLKAAPANWFELAGFESKWDAEGSGCHKLNYKQFRNRERIVPAEGAPA